MVIYLYTHRNGVKNGGSTTITDNNNPINGSNLPNGTNSSNGSNLVFDPSLRNGHIGNVHASITGDVRNNYNTNHINNHHHHHHQQQQQQQQQHQQHYRNNNSNGSSSNNKSTNSLRPSLTTGILPSKITSNLGNIQGLNQKNTNHQLFKSYLTESR